MKSSCPPSFLASAASDRSKKRNISDSSSDENHETRKKVRKISTETKRWFSELNDDVLFEILLRVPDLGNALTVSKSWRSLISDPLFLRLHRTNHTLPYTNLFNIPNVKPCMEIFSDQSRVLHKSEENPSSPYLGFLPKWESLTIRASFKDLVVASTTRWRYYICNPLTKSYIALPETPDKWIERGDVLRVELAVVGRDRDKGSMDELEQYIFKVVILKHGLAGVATSLVFSSESWAWSKSELTLKARPRFDHATTRARVVHWLEYSFTSEVTGISAFDPFKAAGDPGRCRLIEDFNLTMRLGVVRGRVRLSQLRADRDSEAGILLRIWELKGERDWDLKYEIRWKRDFLSARP